MLVKDVAHKIQQDINVLVEEGDQITFIITSDIHQYETDKETRDGDKYTPGVLVSVGEPMIFTQLDVKVERFRLTIYGWAKQRHAVEAIFEEYKQGRFNATTINDQKVFLYSTGMKINDFLLTQDGFNKNRFEATVDFEVHMLPFTYDGTSISISLDDVPILYRSIQYRKDKSIIQNINYGNDNKSVNLVSDAMVLELPLTEKDKVQEIFGEVLDNSYNKKHLLKWEIGAIEKVMEVIVRVGNITAVNNANPLTFYITLEIPYPRQTVTIDGIELDILDKTFNAEKTPVSVLRDINGQYIMKGKPLRYQNALDLVIALPEYSERPLLTTVSTYTYAPSIDYLFEILKNVGMSCNMNVLGSTKTLVLSDFLEYDAADNKYVLSIGQPLKDLNLNLLEVGTIIKETIQHINRGWTLVDELEPPYDYDLMEGQTLPKVTEGGLTLRAPALSGEIYEWVELPQGHQLGSWNYDLLIGEPLPTNPTMPNLGVRRQTRVQAYTVEPANWQDFEEAVNQIVLTGMPNYPTPEMVMTALAGAYPELYADLGALYDYGYIIETVETGGASYWKFKVLSNVESFDIEESTHSEFTNSNWKVDLKMGEGFAVSEVLPALIDYFQEPERDILAFFNAKGVIRTDDGLGHNYYKLKDLRSVDYEYFTSELKVVEYEYYESYYEVESMFNYWKVVSIQTKGIATRKSANTIAVVIGSKAVELDINGDVSGHLDYPLFTGVIDGVVPANAKIVKVQEIIDEIKTNDKNRVFEVVEHKYGKIYKHKYQIATGMYQDKEHPDLFLVATFIESDV